MTTRPLSSVSFLLVAVAAAIGLSACGRGDSAPAHDDGPPVAVTAVVVADRTEAAHLDLSGELVAQNRMEIASKIAGRINSLPVTEGTVVRRGDVLARLDSPELASALAQSQAAEEAARVNDENAQRQLQRMRRLVKGEVVTPHDVEMAESMAAGAAAAHERAKAMTKMSKQNLDYAVLRAPADGVVVKRLARAGDLATPGRPIVILENPKDLEVRVTLPAELAWPVHPGDRAEVRSALDDGDPRPATVNRVTPGADRHTIEVYLRPEGMNAPSGSFVRATLFGADSVEALRLPDGALVHRGPLTGAFLVQRGHAVLRWLRLGPDGRVEAGLSPGDTVIASPPSTLEDGDPVEVTR
jgi:RND family efflux transporter MFP subunit